MTCSIPAQYQQPTMHEQGHCSMTPRAKMAHCLKWNLTRTLMQDQAVKWLQIKNLSLLSTLEDHWIALRAGLEVCGLEVCGNALTASDGLPSFEDAPTSTSYKID
eukprot:4274240-Amphidinium_carterae.1